LAPAEINYKIHNRELLTIIYALCYWFYLLYTTPPDQPIIIWTDYKNLTCWSESQKVGPYTATWQVELQQYNFELYHKLGELNKADALSHQPNYNTGNPANEHLIVLPHDHFIGMPSKIYKTMQPHPCLECAICNLDDILALESDLQANVAGLEEENDTIIEDNLNN
jgi:hypothetical protein